MTRLQFTKFLVERYLSALVTISIISSCDHVNESIFLEPATPVGLEWVKIPGGKFFMGSNEWFDEQPISRVSVKSFEMSRTEITVAQYRECVDAKICSEPDGGGEYENWNEPGYEDHPVNAIDWHQARAFCNWVGGDLPSESMWEYAAKSAGQPRLYPWGDKLPSCDLTVMNDKNGISGCGTKRTLPVCSRKEGNTDQGLCDMAGNVWEWVLDWYHGIYDCKQDLTAHNCELGGAVPKDGSAWSETGKFIVERGGSFNSDSFYLRTATRLRVWPTKRSYGLGFRCAKIMQ